MKLCISSQDKNLDANVSERFGRSTYFIIYDTKTDSFEAIKNANSAATSGAGIKTAQSVIEKKVDALITGNPLGPKAAQIINATSIEVVIGVSGTVKLAIQQYLEKTVKL